MYGKIYYKKIFWDDYYSFFNWNRTFFLLSAIPGTAIDKKIQKLPEETKKVVIQKYGYDKPVIERYFITLKNYIFKGEFGESLVHAGDTVSSIVKNKMPVSSRLGIQQILVGVTIGIILGIIAAMNRGKVIDYSATRCNVKSVA